MQKADEHQVPAGGALAVDRDGFAAAVTEAVKANPLVTVIHEEVTDLESLEGTVIVASGPLTSDALFADIKKLLQADYLHFFDAAAPIVTADSLDYDKVYRASRYDKAAPTTSTAPSTRRRNTLPSGKLSAMRKALPLRILNMMYLKPACLSRKWLQEARTPCASVR